MSEAHEKRIDIRWRDLDAYGHVNQAVYLTFAEEALDAWFRRRLALDEGRVWDYVAAKTTIEYRSELRLEDVQAVGTVELVRLGTKSVTATHDAAGAGRTRGGGDRVDRRRARRQGRREPRADGGRAGSTRRLGRDRRPVDDLVDQAVRASLLPAS